MMILRNDLKKLDFWMEKFVDVYKGNYFII